MHIDLSGRVALVTGGTRGIGRAIAQTLAEAGAEVVICARTQEHVEATTAELNAVRKASGIALDVSLPESAPALVNFVNERHGQLDILVNNAVTSVQDNFEGLTDEHWMLHLNTKLLAYVRLCRAALPLLAASGQGRIVNVAGMSARQVTDYRMTNGAVNAAVTNFTKHLSRQTAARGVTVNTVHPGFTMTPRLEQGLARWAVLSGTTPQQEYDTRVAEIPLGRFIDPKDIANVVAFLASPHAAAVTGQAIAVDGGSGMGIPY